MSAGNLWRELDLPLTPALSLRERGKGSRFGCSSKSELNSVSHVGAFLTNAKVSPLSLWERVRRAAFR
jgi:hypothetical protein